MDQTVLIDIINNQGDHSIFAPSYSKTILSCPGSLIPGLFVQDQASHYEAVEGTVAHQVASEWLLSGIEPRHLIGSVIDDVMVTQEMLDHLSEYVEWCDELEGDKYVETRVDFSDLTPIPNQFGTADHATCSEGKLIITDLKFGKRILVSTDNNTQLYIYAYGFFKLYDSKYNFKEIVLRIAQPRMFNFQELVIKREEFLTKVYSFKEYFKAAWSTTAPRRPTIEGCEWCKLRSNCGARLVQVDSLLQLEPEPSYVGAGLMSHYKESMDIGLFDLKAPDIYNLTTDQMANILLWRKFVDKFFDSIFSELERRVNEDLETVEGFDLLPGRSVSEWSDEENTIEVLSDHLSGSDILSRKIVSPNKAKELMIENGYSSKEVKEILKDLVVKRKGEIALRPIPKRKDVRSKDDNYDFSD